MIPQIASQPTRTVPQSIEDLEPASTSTSALPHVLLVVDQFPRALGGGERAALQLAALLPQYGFRVSLLTFLIHPESAVLSMAPVCPVYLLPLERTYDFKAFRSALALGRFLRSQEVRIVQTFFESSDLWAGAVVKTLSSARLIWSRRDMGILRTSKHRFAYRLMARVPDLVFAVSDRVRQHCIEVDGVNKEQACTIYNGLEPGLFGVRRLCGTGIVTVTSIGNIRRIKGHDLFVRAAHIVTQQMPKVRFQIVGEVLEESYYDELKSLVLKLELSDDFFFAGGVEHAAEYLAHSDIFVLPSRSEGFSNAILEAMAYGLPVIATDVGGNAEAVESGRSGLIVPGDDVDALASAILRLVADPEEAARMGDAARARAKEKFSSAAMMEQVSAAYETLLAPRR